MDANFQKLKRQWSVIISQREEIVERMRENLIQRNHNESVYECKYVQKGITYDLSSCSVEDLFAVDGDMVPLGL